MPAGVVPDEHPHFLAEHFEFLGAPIEKPSSYPAHWPAIDEPQPRLLKLGDIQPVAREGLRRMGVVFGNRPLNETQRLPLLGEALKGREEPPCCSTSTRPRSPQPSSRGRSRPSSSAGCAAFFLSYSGSGEVIHRLARCQRTPIRSRVARIVSPETRFSVSPSSKKLTLRRPSAKSKGCCAYRSFSDCCGASP